MKQDGTGPLSFSLTSGEWEFKFESNDDSNLVLVSIIDLVDTQSSRFFILV
jgi:hypothetical protein